MNIETLISVVLQPKTVADQEKMGIALSELAKEDPSFRGKTDEETGETIISAMSEDHLDDLLQRISDEFNVKFSYEDPRVSCREEGKGVFLEPIMKVVVNVPREVLGGVYSILSRRRGSVYDQEDLGSDNIVLHALVPLLEMFGFTADLRQSTGGYATYSMEFSKYTEIRTEIAEGIISRMFILPNEKT
jgi:translation elongation factor EF-G